MSDNSKDCIKACSTINWTHNTNTLHRSETNRVIERTVRRFPEGTAATSVQGSHPDEPWDCGTARFYILHNVTDKRADGRHRMNNSTIQKIIGTSSPSGATGMYKPSKLKNETRIHHSEGNCWTCVDYFGNQGVAL